MRAKAVFAALVLTAAVIPALIHARSGQPAPGASHKVAWPTHLQGASLTQLPPSVLEQRFADRFPGHIGRFTDGSRHIIVRVLQEPTRMLHPAADCFRGLGYGIARARVMEDAAGITWSCFTAERGGMTRTVCERIYDSQGKSWTDVSSWYWAAMLGGTTRPWVAVTVVSEP
jgi:hypothetical protein